MSKWSRILDISEDWKKAEKGEITCRDLAVRIANELAILPAISPNNDLKKKALIDYFLKTPENITPDLFDNRMELLYTWGDLSLGVQEKVCWIKTHV